MPRQSLQALAVTTVAVLALGLAPAAALTPISACGDLTKAGETYVLSTDLTHRDPNACLLVSADRITIDLAGHTISGLGMAAVNGVGIRASGKRSLVVKNGTIDNFRFNIELLNSPRATIRNVTVTGAVGAGISIPLGSGGALVKDCTARGNSTGIHVNAEEGTQVEGCLLDGNGGGILGAGDRMLVIRNIVRNNAGFGMWVGHSSTVAHNTVHDNGLDGILVGAGSLVTRNTSNDNDRDGIAVACPSTITHNTALRNEGWPIYPPTSSYGCIVLHNLVDLN